MLRSFCTRLRACRAGLSAAGAWWMAGVHCPVWSALTARWRTGPALLASLISCSVTAFGVASADKKRCPVRRLFLAAIYRRYLHTGVAGHVVGRVVLACAIRYCEAVELQTQSPSFDAGRWLLIWGCSESIPVVCGQ